MGEKRVFPKMMEVPEERGRSSYEKKCIFHERILFHYLERKIEGWSVRNFLEKERIEKYALYAVTDFTNLFLKELEQDLDSHFPKIICDRNAIRYDFKYKGQLIVLQDELIRQYKRRQIDKIIVMSILHENEIINELQKRDVLLNDIISFVSVLYS